MRVLQCRRQSRVRVVGAQESGVIIVDECKRPINCDYTHSTQKTRQPLHTNIESIESARNSRVRLKRREVLCTGENLGISEKLECREPRKYMYALHLWEEF